MATIAAVSRDGETVELDAGAVSPLRAGLR
jgi:hypothetical protein